ncbi:hypothetical protein F503_07140 [Ophiostoma piceae UAMH 11346]|uniref:Uncharacterized protein n=1 Tax=Ophiostoma piceae (strain UAMH 11346) TaxID=1262450 RepID=S3C746_OPHP1|nr:hypothetical protein F503_07140 [Ophiostoma piceae UAMH 11346]
MKYSIAAIAAFAAASAVATPAFSGSTKRGVEQCVFGTYACTTDGTGIQICDIAGQWELVGPCPDGTSCEDLPQNGSDLPFCTNTATKKAKRGGYGWCPTPGQYSCDGYNAIQVCNTTNGLEKVGDCPSNSHCAYIGEIPYCVNN